jgi:hypothetical protein
MAQSSNILEKRPPWDLYPGEPPYSGQYRQGNGEIYLNHIWLPFWRMLPAGQQEEYLRHWKAPEDWRSHLKQIEMSEEEWEKWLEQREE